MDKKSLVFMGALTVSFFLINNVLFPPKQLERPAIKSSNSVAVVSSSPSSNDEVISYKELQDVEKKEKFFVIENDYQQLVFSNVGGALAEINLRIESAKHPKSVVKEIEFDRDLRKNHPDTCQFPLQPYQNFLGSQLPSTDGKYYPLLRRSVGPKNYALNLSSSNRDNDPIFFRVTKLEKNLIEFEGTTDSQRITKTFSFPSNADDLPYCFDLNIKVEGKGSNLSLNTGIPEVEMVSGNAAPVLKYRFEKNKKAVVEQIDLPKNSTTYSSSSPDWICNSNGFLGLIVNPTSSVGDGFSVYQIPGEKAKTRLSSIFEEHELFPASKYPGYEMQIPLSKGAKTTSFHVFAGPFSTKVLKTIDSSYSNKKTGQSSDYLSCQSFHGWFAFISAPFAKFLFMLMSLFYAVTHSWGFSIILLTFALRLMLYPLNAWSIKSTVKMQKIAPLVAKIQEKHKKDPKKAQVEIMNLYRENKVNPLGGCFPMLIQMPFLIGMFDLLKSAFELRGASFIPGWIDNLTAPDVVFSWNYPVWFFGNSLHLLPFLLGAVMYFQQKMSATTPSNIEAMTDQQRQQKFMGNIMVVVFTVLFYHFPSGLNIYWLSSMLIGMGQQWLMTRDLKNPVKA